MADTSPELSEDEVEYEDDDRSMEGRDDRTWTGADDRSTDTEGDVGERMKSMMLADDKSTGSGDDWLMASVEGDDENDANGENEDRASAGRDEDRYSPCHMEHLLEEDEEMEKRRGPKRVGFCQSLNGAYFDMLMTSSVVCKDEPEEDEENDMLNEPLTPAEQLRVCGVDLSLEPEHVRQVYKELEKHLVLCKCTRPFYPKPFPSRTLVRVPDVKAGSMEDVPEEIGVLFVCEWCGRVSRARLRIPLAGLDTRTVAVINHLLSPTTGPAPPPPNECRREEDVTMCYCDGNRIFRTKNPIPREWIW